MTKYLVTAIPHPNNNLDGQEEIVCHTIVCHTKASAIQVALDLAQSDPLRYDYVAVNEIGETVYCIALNDETEKWEENIFTPLTIGGIE